MVDVFYRVLEEVTPAEAVDRGEEPVRLGLPKIVLWLLVAAAGAGGLVEDLHDGLLAQPPAAQEYLVHLDRVGQVVALEGAVQSVLAELLHRVAKGVMQFN